MGETMTYTITITEPGVEPVAIPKPLESAAVNSIMKTLYAIDGLNEASFFSIMNTCITLLGSVGALNFTALEWTTDAPKVAGLYFAKGYRIFCAYPTAPKSRYYFKEPIDLRGPYEANGFCIGDGDSTFGPNKLTDFIQETDMLEWLGPIPLAAGGE